MIHAHGTVIESRRGRARVEMTRPGGCASCGGSGACGCSGGGRPTRLWAEDPLGVAPGDRVVVAVPDGTVFKAGLLVYLVPAAALLAGAVAGNALAPSLGLSEDLGAAALGLLAMGGALAASRFLGGGPCAGPRVTGREGS